MQAVNMLNNGMAVLRARWHLRAAELVGSRVRLWGRAVVHSMGSLIVRDRVRLVGTITPLELATGPEGHLEIGEGTFINYGCSLHADLSVRIGARCSLGTYCMLMDNDFHSLNASQRHKRPPSRPIVLEDDVWLGARVIVLRGVTIGVGSVVGAGSIVTHDIPPHTLAVGVPARPIRDLADEHEDI
jgi:acetyltransferase-like isoleucine patch superfamily enzyme